MIVNMGVPVTMPDNEVAKVMVWRDTGIPKNICVNIAQAVTQYPNESINNAIQAMAAEIFKFMERMAEQKANTVTGFTGYD